MFLATDLEEGEQKLDEGEYCEVVKYNIDELINMIHIGKIVDSKTIIGIHAAKDYIQKKS